MRRIHFNRLLLLGLLCCLSGEVFATKKLYRVVDENGNVYFSDQVPPDKAKLKRETLGEDARVLDVVEKAKTQEQIDMQKRLDALRKEQEKIVAKQASNDKVLLSTYRSLDDMNKAMENKLAALAIEQRLIEGNIKRYEQQLLQQQQQAAEHERNARKVPEKLLGEIAASKQMIDASKLDLARHAQDIQKTEKDFKADMARFQFLTQAGSNAKPTAKSLAESNAVNALGLYVCVDAQQCDKAWKIAADFVAKYSTTGQDVATDSLIMHAAPVNDQDLSLSVSKLTQSGQQQIFLDVRCKQNSFGAELCASSNVQSLRQSFAPFIQSQLSSQQ